MRISGHHIGLPAGLFTAPHSDSLTSPTSPPTANTSLGNFWRHPALWTGLAGAAAVLVGAETFPTEAVHTAGEMLRFGAFGLGAYLTARAGFNGAKGLYSAGRALIFPALPATETRELLAQAVRDYDTTFDARLSLLMLEKEGFLTKNLRLYRDEYARLKRMMQEDVSKRTAELDEQKTKFTTIAKAFDVTAPLPVDSSDKTAWEAFFSAIETNADAYTREEYVKLMQKRDLILGLLETRANLMVRIGEFDAIESAEFTVIEERIAAAHGEHRARIVKEDWKLQARRIINDDDAPAYALVEHGERLNAIALSFLDSFRTLFDNVSGRLAAAAVANHPETDRGISAPARVDEEAEAARPRPMPQRQPVGGR